MKRILTLIGSFLLIFVGAISVLSIALGSFMAITDDMSFLESDLSGFLSYCMLFLLVIVGFEIFKSPMKLDMPTFVPQFRKLNLPMIVGSFITILALGVVLEPLFNLLPDIGMDVLYKMVGNGLWTTMTVIVAAPILEEYIFRGVIQRTLIRASSPWVGILISAFIFGAIHGIPIQAANAMVMGILLGMVYYITNSLMTVVVIHFLNNGLAYLQTLYFGQEDPSEILFDTPLSYTIFYAVSFIIVVAFALYAVGAIRKKRVSLSIGTDSTDSVTQ